MTKARDPAGMALEQLEQGLAAWQDNELASFLERQPEGKSEYKTASGTPLERLYTALDVVDTPLVDHGATRRGNKRAVQLYNEGARATERGLGKIHVGADAQLACRISRHLQQNHIYPRA